jgi:hypothetical protein
MGWFDQLFGRTQDLLASSLPNSDEDHGHQLTLIS